MHVLCTSSVFQDTASTTLTWSHESWDLGAGYLCENTRYYQVLWCAHNFPSEYVKTKIKIAYRWWTAGYVDVFTKWFEKGEWAAVYWRYGVLKIHLEPPFCKSRPFKNCMSYLSLSFYNISCILSRCVGNVFVRKPVDKWLWSREQ